MAMARNLPGTATARWSWSQGTPSDLTAAFTGGPSSGRSAPLNPFTHPPSSAHGTTRLADRWGPRSGALHSGAGSATASGCSPHPLLLPSPCSWVTPTACHLPSEPLKRSWECRLTPGRA